MALTSIRAIMIKPYHTFTSVECTLIHGTSSMAFLLLAPARQLGPGNDFVVQSLRGADIFIFLIS